MGVAKTKPKGWLYAVIERADGTVEDLGCVASTDEGSMEVREDGIHRSGGREDPRPEEALGDSERDYV